MLNFGGVIIYSTTSHESLFSFRGAGPSADPPSSAANVEPDVEFQCDLCAGRGSLNSYLTSEMVTYPTA